MATLTEIANRALVLIGEPEITQITEGTERALACNTAWPGVRDEVLRSNNWNCAIARKKLAQLSEEPAFGWEHQYQLPTDCLRVIGVWGSDVPDDYPQILYRIEGRRIVTDSPHVYLRYVKQETDTTQYDAVLTAVMVARLAERIAPRLTSSETITERARQAYEDAMARAGGVDVIEQPPPRRPQSPWVTRRY